MTDRLRIPPVPHDELDEDARALLARVGLPAGESMNIFSTLVRHPQLFKRWLGFGGVLLSGRLPARDRELLILRTAQRTGAAYEWAHHVEIAERVGVTADEVTRVTADAIDDDWDPFDRALLEAADELHDANVISGPTWATLAERYDEEQLIEVPMVVGQYHLVAYTLRSLGVQLEDGYS